VDRGRSGSKRHLVEDAQDTSLGLAPSLANRHYGKVPTATLDAVPPVRPGARQGDRAEASFASSTRVIEFDAFVWSNNTVRVLARNISSSAFDLSAAALSVAATKRRIP
jgi:hypothetical protein